MKPLLGDVAPFSDEERDIFAHEDTHLYALSLGFDSAADMKEWGEQVERERLAELACNNEEK